MIDFKQIELEMLDFWKKNKIYAKSRAKCHGKDYYFLDGPPYTSGRIHIGQAWNKCLKDAVLRFKRMQGFKVWDRAGYDMHGLPTAHKVEQKFGIKHKGDIPAFGVDKFIEECKKLAIENMELMNKDFERLGVWMDFKNAYTPITNEFIEGEWWLIKQAHKNKRLYEGEKVMHWCPQCRTTLAKHELEYKNRTDNSIFLKFKIKGREREHLIIWTTTPWTIPFNLGVMVNPNFDYIKVDVGGEKWIIAKELAPKLIEEILGRKYEIKREFKGSELEGLEYIHPFEGDIREFEELKKKYENVHTVLLSKKYVNLDAGSGLVHCAPGCGPEDYEVGREYGLPPLNNLDETGKFGFDFLKNLVAKKNDREINDLLFYRKSLIIETPVEHEYAHCWRCKSPIIFRTTTQWFFKVEDLIPQMRELNKKVLWQPNWAGKKWFDSWLENLKDNSITRQRYWGTPLPIWKCDSCKDYVVIGSPKELKKLAGGLPKDLHRPYIDEVTIPCKCGALKTRIPDILDVWIDAGTTSWNCLDYPSKDNLFKKLFPADFILEGKDQIRGWFNLLLVSSMISMKKPSYKAVYMHGFVQDTKGEKMSKSLGNIISPYKIIDKYSSELLRYYMIGGSSPGVDINYNEKDMNLKNKNLMVLYNLCNFLKSYSDINAPKLKIEDAELEEKYIISKLNSTIQKVTESFEKYEINKIPWLVEELFLELSRTYIQLTRDKVVRNKKIVATTVYTVLIDCLKLFAPICPMISEKIYQNLKDLYNLPKQSIHLYDWPVADPKKIDTNLEKSMISAKEVIQEILSQREQVKMGIKWPLAKATITTENPVAVKKLKELIKTQTNIKELDIKKGTLKVKLTTKLTKELEQEGYSREVMRKIQSLRKQVGLNKQDKIKLAINSKYDLSKFDKEIMEKCGSVEIYFIKKRFKHNSKEKIRDQTFDISLDLYK